MQSTPALFEHIFLTLKWRYLSIYQWKCLPWWLPSRCKLTNPKSFALWISMSLSFCCSLPRPQSLTFFGGFLSSLWLSRTKCLVSWVTELHHHPITVETLLNKHNLQNKGIFIKLSCFQTIEQLQISIIRSSKQEVDFCLCTSDLWLQDSVYQWKVFYCTSALPTQPFSNRGCLVPWCNTSLYVSMINKCEKFTYSEYCNKCDLRAGINCILTTFCTRYTLFKGWYGGWYGMMRNLLSSEALLIHVVLKLHALCFMDHFQTWYDSWIVGHKRALLFSFETKL